MNTLMRLKKLMLLALVILGGCSQGSKYIQRQNFRINGRCNTKILVFVDNGWWVVYDEWDRMDCE